MRLPHTKVHKTFVSIVAPNDECQRSVGLDPGAASGVGLAVGEQPADFVEFPVEHGGEFPGDRDSAGGTSGSWTTARQSTDASPQVTNS